MRMLKKYWWVILAALIYWKWDVISSMLVNKKDEYKNPSNNPVDPEYGPMNLPNTSAPFEADEDNNNIPDYLQA